MNRLIHIISVIVLASVYGTATYLIGLGALPGLLIGPTIYALMLKYDQQFIEFIEDSRLAIEFSVKMYVQYIIYKGNNHVK